MKRIKIADFFAQGHAVSVFLLVKKAAEQCGMAGGAGALDVSGQIRCGMRISARKSNDYAADSIEVFLAVHKRESW